MAPVTVDTGAIGGAGSGATGWSSNNLFPVYEGARISPVGVSAPQQIIGSATANQKIAQSFTPSGDGDVAWVDLHVARTGSSADNMVLEIQTNSSSLPSGTPVGSSWTFPINSLPTAGHDCIRFICPNTISLTGGVKYWLVLGRSGAVDAANYYNPYYNSESPTFAGHGLSIYNGTSWSAEHATNDLQMAVVLDTVRGHYLVSQDTKLHVFKSTDNGANWTEQNSAGAPTVNSSTKPFSAYSDVGLVGCGYFTATNTANVRFFDCYTDTWATADLATTPSTDVDFNRPIRFVFDLIINILYYSSLLDPTDLENVRRGQSGAWGGQTALVSGTHANSSTVVDTFQTVSGASTVSELSYAVYYDGATSTLVIRSYDGVGTQNTALTIDATAADSDTEHISGSFQLYGSPKKALVVFADVDGHLQERTAQLEVVSSGVTLGTQHEIDNTTDYIGRSVASCVWDGDGYVFAVHTASGMDVWANDSMAGTWANFDYDWITGTNMVVHSAVPITGTGVLVSYTDNGNSMVNLFSLSTNETGTHTRGQATSAGGAHVAGGGVRGTTTLGTSAAAGGVHSGRLSYTATHTRGQATSTGGSHVAGSGTRGTTTVGTASAAGGSHTGTATTVVNETGTTTVGTAAAAGGGHVISANASGTTVAGRASAGSYIQALNELGSVIVGSLTAEAVAQSITAVVTGTHTSLDIKGFRTATVNGNVWFEVQSNATDRPSGTVMVTSDVKAKTSLPTSSDWITFTFTTPYTLTGGTRYWFCYCTDVINATQTFYWRFGSNPDQWDDEGSSSLNDGVWSAGNLASDHVIVIPSLTTGVAGATGVHTTSNAAASGGTHTGTGGSSISETGTATAGSATATGGSQSAGAGTRGTHTLGTSTATGGTHTGSGLRNETGTTTRGQATSTGGLHTGAGQRLETGTATVGTSSAIGLAHSGGGGARGTTTVGTSSATGMAHTAGSGSTGVASLGTAAASGGLHTSSLTQTTGVISDVSAGDWTREDGSTSNLYDSVNEVVIEDADYIRSPISPASPSAVVLQLGPLEEPTVRTDHIISYRYSVDAPIGTTLTVRLYQGATLIATDTPVTPTESWVTRDWELAEADAEDITDYADLRVELEAVVT